MHGRSGFSFARAAPSIKSYTATPLPNKTASTSNAGQAGIAQYFVSSQDIPAEWWSLFRSPELNNLINKGLANSPNLAAAQATLRQAQESLKAQVDSVLYPAVNAGISAQRQRANLPSLGIQNQENSAVFNSYNTSVSVRSTCDVYVFGGGLQT